MTLQHNNEEDKAKADAETGPPDAATSSKSKPIPIRNAPSMESQRKSSALATHSSPELPPRNLFGSAQRPNPTTKQKGPAASAVDGYNGRGTKEKERSADRASSGPPSRHGGSSEQDHSPSEMHPPICMCDCDVVELLRDTAHRPPVTTETLQELDLQWIQNNVNLRVDVHYDHDLHFMPVSGRRGEEKRLEARNYWHCLELELRIYQQSSNGECQICICQPPTSTSFIPRLPSLFAELRKLLFILVPERERIEVDQTLDVDLLMQQIRNNALDIVRLSTWLSDLLTTHCAPVRDEWAEDMARKISDGARQADMASLVVGLEKLFSFCEAMKLDVANHQIRTFRTPLIEDGVSFQQDYFSTRIQNGKLDIRSSRNWFLSVDQKLLEQGELSVSGSDVLIAGLVELCVFPDLHVPKTLKHDMTRIRQMQEECQDILHLRICLQVFDWSVYQLFGRDFNPSAMHQALKTGMKTRIMDLTDGEAGAEESTIDLWQTNIESIAIEVTRALSAVARTANRVIPPGVQQVLCCEVNRRFKDKKAGHDLASQLGAGLRSQASSHAETFRRLPALRISEVQKQYQQDRQSRASARLMPDVEDISRRLAHIATIHWEVWGNLAYKKEIVSIADGVHCDSADMESSRHLEEERRNLDDTLCEYDMV